ncbi:MAG TPA: O-antigen ligase family protein [Devosia sp.]|nr:O-antigen ligase family protein [Devosia sp.]
MMRHSLSINLAAVLAITALAALMLNAMLGTLAALVFLVCGGLLIISNIPQSLDSVMRWWVVLLLPAYCLLTALWSQYPDNTLRYGLQLAFTLVVGVVMTGRMSTTTLMRGLFVVYAIGVVASVVIGHNGGAAWLGIFGSKNAFAAHMAVFALISVAMVADRDAHPLLRLAALGGALISAPLLVLAQSAGAILMVVPCVAIIVLVLLTGRLSPHQKLFLGAFVALALAGLALLVVTAGDTLLADVLEGSGKDPTLTGRTDLWATGLSFIAERPLQGLGYRAFWVSGFAPAEELWAMFLVPSGAGFNFHNTYISNAVEIGLIGLLLQILIIYGGAIMIGAYAMVRPSASTAMLLGLQVLMILRSFIEVEVFFEFSIRSILAVCTFIYAAQGLLALRAARRARPASGFPYHHKGLIDA